MVGDFVLSYNLNGQYAEDLSYDKNGNITTLKRYGQEELGQPIEIDDLTYTYTANQLQTVTDATNNPEGFNDGNTTGVDYVYDSFGNMITDKNKSITAISYNHLNLPYKVTFANGGNISFVYDAAGTRLSKKVQPNGGALVTTDYVNGFQYENNELQFFPHPEGYVKRNENNTYLYVYQYKDHLGNVRLSYADVNKNGTIELATEILEENNYYPFGLKHKGYNNIANSNRSEQAERYKFNGMEWQPELGLDLYDFGARNYDAAIGRWLNVDPLAEKYIDTTPYNYVYNNPVIFKDPDGKRVIAANTESQNLILNTLIELLGENHGFAFNKKGELYHRNNKKHKSSANKYTKEQNNIYKGFLEIMGDKDRTISFSNQSGDDTSYKVTFMIDSYDFDYVDGIAQKDSQGNFIKKKFKAPLYFEAKHKVKGVTGGGVFLTTNESQDYAVSIVFPDIAKSRQFKSANGYTTPSLSGIVVHELLDHGVDFIRTGNNNSSKSSSVNNVNYQNDALIIINSQTRVGHDSH